MAVLNNKGESISYECSRLIRELKDDIVEFGEDKQVMVWVKKIHEAIIYTNYDFEIDVDLLEENEQIACLIEEDEQIIYMSMKDLLIFLENQNSIF